MMRHCHTGEDSLQYYQIGAVLIKHYSNNNI